jgi:hypothetical protein
LGTLSRSLFIVPLLGLDGCQLVAGIDEITYAPAEASPAAVDEGSSGHAQAPVDAMVDEAQGSSQTLANDATSGSPSDTAPSNSGSNDATSDGPSDNARSDSRSDAASDSPSHDEASESASDASLDTSAGDAGDAAASCSNPLGAVWSETEANGMCISTWTRQGSTITVSGDSLSVARTNSSDGNDCTYTGTFGADCLIVIGTYTCTKDNGSTGKWSATIAP